MKYYFIGIKGTGMSALACYLKDLGYDVSGCDVNRYIFTQDNLDRHHILYDDFSSPHYQDYDCIILGNAFQNHTWIDKLTKKQKLVVSYQEILNQLSTIYPSIAICGTHGKTTTSHMIHTVFFHHQCSCIIGDGYGCARQNPEYFIFEACEYQDNFLNYRPNIIVLTNIDFDHVDYFKNQEQYNQSFCQFLNQAKDFVLLNNDDLNSESIKKSISKPVFTYGIDKPSDVMASNVVYDSKGTTFSIIYQQQKYENLHLPIYGQHLFYDALASIALGLILNEPIAFIIHQLENFTPAKRRFNIYQKNSNVIVDDYGHHPKEIKLTIQSIKQKYPTKTLKIIFHPDRSSRIAYFFDNYLTVFRQADSTFIIPFINTQKESNEEKLLQSFCKHPRIQLFSDTFYQHDYENTVFLFTGSKDMHDNIQKLLDIL